MVKVAGQKNSDHMTIPPTEVEDGEDLKPATRSKKTLVSSAAAAKAAVEAGMSVFGVGKLKASGKLGEFIGQVGALQIGRSMLAIASERMLGAIDQCEELYMTVKDDEMKLEAIRLKRDVLDSYAGIANNLIKSAPADSAKSEEQLNRPGFSIPQITTPVQINVGRGQEVTVVQSGPGPANQPSGS